MIKRWYADRIKGTIAKSPGISGELLQLSLNFWFFLKWFKGKFTGTPIWW